MTPENKAPDITGSHEIDIVGESIRHEAHAQIYPGETGVKSIRVGLVREPYNQHDANAIAVYCVDVHGRMLLQLGYVDRDTARQAAGLLDAVGGVAVCNASIGRNDPWTVWRVQMQVDFDNLR